MKNANEIVKDFETAVHRIVRGAFPKLIAKALAGVQPTVRKRSARKPKPEPKTEAPVASVVKAQTSPGGTYRRALIDHGSKRAAAKALGMAESTFRDRLSKEQVS